MERERRAGGLAGRGGAHARGQVAQGDLRSASHDHAVLDGGPQFADIARPVVGAGGLKGGIGDRQGSPPALGDLVKEMPS